MATDDRYREKDIQDPVRTPKATADEVPYRDGSIRGRAAEQAEQQRLSAERTKIYERRARLQASNSNTSSIFTVLAIVLVAGIVGGLLFRVNDTAETTPTDTVPEQLEPEGLTAPEEANPLEEEADMPEPVAPAAESEAETNTPAETAPPEPAPAE